LKSIYQFGRLISNNNWSPNLNVDELNACIENKMKDLVTNSYSNQEAIEIRKILKLKKSILKDIHS
jgi:hypothetical protein